MTPKKLMPADEVGHICYGCATNRGWVPVPFDVGIYPYKCDDCGIIKDCTPPRDYKYSKSNPLGR